MNGYFVTLIWGRQRAVMWSRVFLETSHSVPFSFLRFTQPTQVTSLFYLFVLFAFEKWILDKRWILRCVILKARPNGSKIIQHSRIQHCWTMLHSVERGGQTNFNTWNWEVWVQNLATTHRKQRCAILVCKDGARSIDCEQVFSCYCAAWNVGKWGW